MNMPLFQDQDQIITPMMFSPNIADNYLQAPSPNQMFGGLSPASSVCSNGRVSTPLNTSGSHLSDSCQYQSDSHPSRILSSVADTLNNYGAAAYHNDLNTSLDAISFLQYDSKQENGLWTYPDNSCDASYLPHTPNPAPLPDCETLPLEEPSHLLQELSIHTANSSPVYVQGNSIPGNINISMEAQPPTPIQQCNNSNIVNVHNELSNNWQATNASAQAQQVSLPYASTSSFDQQASTSWHNNALTELDLAHLDSYDDTLNIPREQLLIPGEDYNIQQLINADANVASSTSSGTLLLILSFAISIIYINNFEIYVFKNYK